MSRLPVIQIVFTRAEGLAHELVPVTFSGSRAWEDVEQHITQARRTAPATGGYDKCDVEITFASDETGDALTYKTRYDMQHLDASGPEDTLARHVCQQWRFYAMRWTPAHLSCEQHESYLRNVEVDPVAYARLCDRYDVPGLETT